MDNIENAVLIPHSPEPRNAPIADVLLYGLVSDMARAAWDILEGSYTAVGDMITMRQRFAMKCKEYSLILYRCGVSDDPNWAVRPVFVEDYPIADVPDPEEFSILFPAGVTYNGTTYSFDIAGYFSGLHRDYIPSVEKVYAEKLAFVRQHKDDDFPFILG